MEPVKVFQALVKLRKMGLLLPNMLDKKLVQIKKLVFMDRVWEVLLLHILLETAMINFCMPIEHFQH